MFKKSKYGTHTTLIVLFIYLSLSCQVYKQNEKIVLQGFNSQEWKRDKRACTTGYRARVYDTILKQEDKLIGLDTAQIKNIFGEEDIFGRKVQNTFAYFYQSGPQCTNEKGDNSWIVISFDNSGIFRGIFIEVQ